MENYNNTSSDALKNDFKPQISNDSLPILNEANVIAEGEEKMTRYLLLLTVATAISGSLFGYDTGVISGALVLIGDDLGAPLTTTSREWITSVLTVGALVGGLSAGVLSDHIGRKRVLLLSDVFFIIGAVCQAAAQNFAAMYAGRLIMGFGVGFASCIAPLFIGEIAPTLKRGSLTTFNVCAITLGQVVAYALGAAFQHVPHGWRYLIAIGGLPAIVQLVLMHLLPESPRYQIRAGKLVEAKATIRRIYPMATEDQIDFKVNVIKEYVSIAMAAERALPFTQRFLNMFRIGKNRRALACGAGLQLLQQLSGFNSLMYYSATIFATIGFSNPTAVGLIVSGTNFLMTCVALQIIDRVGRRKIMIVSTIGMVFGLVLASISFHFLTRNSGGNLVEGFSYPQSWSAVVIVSMVIYVALYAIGTGNVPWLQGELFGIDARGLGTSLSTGANWSGNLVIASTYLTLMEAITPTGTFALYAGICFLGFVFVYFCYPETSGLSLEEVQSIFVDSFGVKKSLALRKQKDAIRQGKSDYA